MFCVKKERKKEKYTSPIKKEKKKKQKASMFLFELRFGSHVEADTKLDFVC